MLLRFSERWHISHTEGGLVLICSQNLRSGTEEEEVAGRGGAEKGYVGSGVIRGAKPDIGLRDHKHMVKSSTRPQPHDTLSPYSLSEYLP